VTHKLLLADDSVTIQRVVELTFSGEDVQVVTVGDGEQAIARIPVEHPDIVLADIGMPKRSGYDVAAFVKGRPDLSHIPVLLLAGAFEPVDDAKAREVQCDGVLVKPFEPQQVIARVRELLGGARGNPTQPAVPEIPRPAEVLVSPRSAALPRPDPQLIVPEGLMDFGAEDLLAPTQSFVSRVDQFLTPVDDFLPPVQPLDSGLPPLDLDDSLDDYFDKLDEAFATINTSSPLDVDVSAPVARREGPVLDSDLDSLDELPSHAVRPSSLETAGITDPFRDLDAVPADEPVVPTLENLLAGMPPGPQAAEISFELAASPPAPSPLAAALTAVGQADLLPTVTDAPPPFEAPVLKGRSIIADAFSALLAVEQGEPGAVPIRLAGNGSTPVITDAVIDDVARRVVQKLALGSSDQMQALVREVVSGIAERLVREEIDRIRRDAPRS
jgi:CheY-like chemotaxis protein